MAKFKVIALTISGAGKKVFRSGEVVDEKQLLADGAKSYVKSGHIKPLKVSKADAKVEVKVEVKADAKVEVKSETKADAKVEAKSGTKGSKIVKDLGNKK